MNAALESCTRGRTTTNSTWPRAGLDFRGGTHICEGMNTHIRDSEAHKLPHRLAPLASLAGLLERLEHEPTTASALQYRQLAQQITILLEQTEPDKHLHALLAIAPATAELYENLRYAHAGLCRSPLESALNAEMAASQAIESARKRPA